MNMSDLEADLAIEELRVCPRGASVDVAVERVCRRLGQRVSYDQLKRATKRRVGLAPGALIGGVGSLPQPPIADAFTGASQFVKPIKQGVLKVVATGDWHPPYHDDVAMAVLFAAMRHLSPDVVVLMGDCVDCYSCSRFSKDPGRSNSLLDEISVANDLLDQVTAPRVHYLEGNHEHRLRRVIADKAPELYGLLEMRTLLKIQERGWTWTDYMADSVRIGKMSFRHAAGGCGKYAGHRALADYGGNVTFGHTHRGSCIYQSTVHGEHRVSLNTGWMGDVEAVDYRFLEEARRDYQHGFGLLYIGEETGDVFAQFHPIVNGTCEVEGVLIGANGPLGVAA